MTSTTSDCLPALLSSERMPLDRRGSKEATAAADAAPSTDCGAMGAAGGELAEAAGRGLDAATGREGLLGRATPDSCMPVCNELPCIELPCIEPL